MTQGLAQKFTDVAFRSGNIVIPPLPVLSVPTTLWAYLGGNLASSQNMVAGAPAITEVGTPEYPTLTVPNMMRCGPTTSSLYAKGYLDTHVVDDSKSFTLAFSARANSAGSGVAQPLACGNTGNTGGTIYVGLGFAAGSGVRCSINGPAISLTLPVVVYYKMKTYVITYDDPTFTMSIYNITDGTSITQVGNSFTRNLSSTTFTVGFMPANSTGNANPSDVAMVGKISGSVTPAQAQAIGSNIRATLALTGMMA